MTDETANLILEYMRRFERTMGDMRADLHDMREELQGVNRRLSNLEEGQALMNSASRPAGRACDADREASRSGGGVA